MLQYRFHTLIPVAAALLCSVQAMGAVPSQAQLRDSLPSAWEGGKTTHSASLENYCWWEQFKDKTLDSLINRAAEANWDVSLAVRRIELARLAVKQAGTSAFPSLSAQAGWQKMQDSGANGKVVVPSVQNDYFNAGISMSWEIDAFGRVAASRKLAKAQAAVSEADRRAVLSSLCANVATAYVNLRLYQTQLEVATEHMASQDQVFNITQARFDCGLASMLDVTQARVVYLSTRATVPTLRSMITNAVNSLAILCGCYPEDLGIDITTPASLPDPFTNLVYIGVPADMLRNRPDIAEAQLEIEAAAARVGIARKEYMPSLTLNGTIGTQAHDVKNLFGKNSMNWSVAPQLSWTIFDGLARKYGVNEAKLELENSVDTYNQTVMNAWQEAQTALNTYTGELESIGIYKEIVVNTTKELQLSLDLYKRGLTSFSNVVDAQMAYLSYQNSLVSEQASALRSLIELYQAIGGAVPK